MFGRLRLGRLSEQLVYENGGSNFVCRVLYD